MDFEQYKKLAYKIAKEHGFYEKEHSNEHYLCLVISELMEAIEASRERKFAQNIMFHKNCDTPQKNPQAHWNYIFDLFIKDTVEDELADACLRLCNLAECRYIDLSVMEKVDENVITPQKLLSENLFEICKVLTSNNDLDVIVRQALSMIYQVTHLQGINICRHIELKMRYNRTRPYKHGKEY